jgi:solute carrier family 25 (mitochondrial citrate transporter), member 1
MPKAGIRFGANAKLKQMMGGDGGKLSSAQQFAAGFGAGCIEAVFAVTPMETIKTKLIQHNLSLVEGVKMIIKESGFGGLYQGLTATIAKQSSNQGLRFMWFNKYKDIMEENQVQYITKPDRTGLTPVGALLGGMSAGCFSTLGNNPFDVVKTRMQGTDAKKYKNTMDCFVQIMKNEGLKGYYRGCLARMGRVVPGQGIIFASMNTVTGLVNKFL